MTAVRGVVICKGRVQGVGFRPFVLRVAANLGLKGTFENLADGSVRITIEGPVSAVREFFSTLRERKPEIVDYEFFDAKIAGPAKGLGDLRIAVSEDKAGVPTTPVIPDVGVCKECARDFYWGDSRYRGYTFVNCAVCGPRFTILFNVPYHRQYTVNIAFPLCDLCSLEFHDIKNRRFWAEGTLCRNCGPQYWLVEPRGEVLEADDPIAVAAKLIMEGAIIAVKGIGGFHLVCRSTDDEVVRKLRARKRRPRKPFAVVAPSVAAVRTFAEASIDELRALTSWRRPIVLLRKRQPFPLSELVAPGLDRIGVMLPYAPVHLALFEHISDPALIATSGNPPQHPILSDNLKALRALRGLADYLLVHDREIVTPCDDSVLRADRCRTALIRRSRGFVPEAIPVSVKSTGIAIGVGAEEENAAAVVRGEYAYPTQFIGDCDTAEAVSYLEFSIERMIDLLGVQKVDVVACDKHPQFPSRKVAERLSEQYGASLVAIQHHHAHAATLLAESGIREAVVVVVDGFGYGEDGAAWGGEVLTLTSYRSYNRTGHLAYFPLPGGDAAARHPGRIAAALLWMLGGAERVLNEVGSRARNLLPGGEKELHLVLRMLEVEMECVPCSSCGRLLDAVSAFLDICSLRSYRGEPAIRLEAVAGSYRPEPMSIPVACKEGKRIIDTAALFDQVVSMVQRFSRGIIAASVLWNLGRVFAEVACEVAAEQQVKHVGLSGGVAYNGIFYAAWRKTVKRLGYRPIEHKHTPPGDGGIAVGQAIAALATVFSDE